MAIWKENVDQITPLYENKCMKDEIPTDLEHVPKSILNQTGLVQEYLRKVKFKDEGYSWIILGVMFIANALTVGYMKSFGIIGNAVYDVYPNASGAEVGLMIGFLSSSRNLFSPLASAIANVIGIRNTMILGSFLYITGLTTSFFCTSVFQLSITLGAIVGMSHCIIENCQVIVISNYFESKLSLANGIRVAGQSFGGMLYPLLMTFFLENYGLKLMFIMLSGVTMQLFICSFLMRPFKVHVKIKALDLVNKITENYHHQEDNPLCSNTKENIHELKAKQREIFHKIINNNTVNVAPVKKKVLNFYILKNIHYILFLVMASGLPMLSLFIYDFIIYSRKIVGLTPYEMSMLMLFYGIFDFILRLVLGWLNHKNFYKLKNGYVTCLCLAALAILLLPLATSFGRLMCIVCLYSFGPAGFHASVNVILSETFGKENISSSWGFVKMTIGIFSLILPPIVGRIFDWSRSYIISSLVMGFTVIFCSIWIAIYSPKRCSSSDPEDTNSIER